MPLKKAPHFLRQLLAYPFGRCNFFDARFAQTLHGTEFAQKEILAVLAHAGTIVEDAFADPLFHQELVISIGEAMRLIADALKQTQRTRIGRELQRHRAAGPINLLELFCQTYDGQLVQPEALEFAAGRGKLALAAVDDDQVGQTDGDKPVIPTESREPAAERAGDFAGSLDSAALRSG